MLDPKSVVHLEHACRRARDILGQSLLQPRGDGPGEHDLSTRNAHVDVGRVDLAVRRKALADVLPDPVVAAPVPARSKAHVWTTHIGRRRSRIGRWRSAPEPAGSPSRITAVMGESTFAREPLVLPLSLILPPPAATWIVSQGHRVRPFT
jgi:hypothetical protein